MPGNVVGMDVELRHVRAFVAVARHRSFTRAAEQLMITQPALSRTVAQLETMLRVVLVERTSRHVELTADGALFLPYAERTLAELEQGMAAVGEHVTIRLGFSWLLPDPWAQRTVSAFEKSTGGTVRLVRVDDPLNDLRQGAVDVALVRGAITSTDMQVVHLFDEHRVAVCAVGSPVAEMARLAWRDVPAWPLVVNVLSGTTGPWSWPAGEGPEHVVETDNFDEWIECVAADRGIGVVPEVAMRRNIHPAVRFVPLADAPMSAVQLVFVPRGQRALLRQFVRAAVGASGNGVAG